MRARLQGWGRAAKDMNPIRNAARLLRESAEELKSCHTLAANGNDWSGEPEAKAIYEEHMATAKALEACQTEHCARSGDHPQLPEALTRDDTVHGQEYYPAGPMRAYLDAVCAAFASTAAQPPAGWQPIETAPKDGTPVLAVTDEGITVIRYSMRHNNKDYWRLAVNSSYPADEGFGEATHWMHLPAAPKE